ncbi:2'-5' RNA ligase family protein [Kitasatospora sp. NPDC088548]|uniref:2'-5' RNA ligase family protein n=1 Tax=Kitasatospora sp. NPDC088548 TaxID=3364075 RepID=UPI00382CE679
MPPPRSRAGAPPQGISTAICAVTGVEDEVQDLILPGAFQETLRKRPVKPVFSHEWKDPIGACRQVEEWMPGDPRLPKTTPMGDPWPAQAGALVARVAFNMRTARGRDVFHQVKQWHEEGGGAQWSIGYVVPKGGATKRSGVRIIHKLDLYEVSPVLHGAHPLTMSLEVKGNPASAALALEYKATPDRPFAEPMAGTGVMVALYPPGDLAENLADPQGTPASDLHLTLAYLGPAEALSGTPAALAELVRSTADSAGPLEGEVGGIGRFPDGGDGEPVWVPVDVPGLTALRERIADALSASEFGADLRTDHGFTPHITLGYGLEGRGPVPAAAVSFDTVWVVVGDDRTPVPLTAAPTPVTAAAEPLPPTAAPVPEFKSAHQAVDRARGRLVEFKSAHQAVTEAKALLRPALPIEEKTMLDSLPGSYEEQRRGVADAVRVLFQPDAGDGPVPDVGYVCVESTFPDRVIVTVSGAGDSRPESYSVPYSWQGEDVVLGPPQQVEVAVIAVPAAGSEETEAPEDDARVVRHVEPAVEHLVDATSALAVSGAEPSELELLRPAVTQLLNTLAKKGMHIAGAPGVGAAPPSAVDEGDPYDELEDEEEEWEDEGDPPALPQQPKAVDQEQEEDDSGDGGSVTLDRDEVEEQLKALTAA